MAKDICSSTAIKFTALADISGGFQAEHEQEVSHPAVVLTVFVYSG